MQKRTYGLAGLTKVIGKWSTALFKLRTLLLLKARRESHLIQSHRPFRPLSVYSVDGIDFSLFSLSSSSHYRGDEEISDINAQQFSVIDLILAEDVLCFVSNGPQAVELEKKCASKLRNYFDRSNTSSRKPGEADISHSVTGNNRKESRSHVVPLVAWMCEPAQRWKDLLAIAEADILHCSDKTINNSNNSKNLNPPASAKRPLLLLFPHHNDPCTLGVYRSLLSFERWLGQISNLDLFTQAVSHLSTVPQVGMRVVVDDQKDDSKTDSGRESLLDISVHSVTSGNSSSKPGLRGLLACFLYVRLLFPLLELLIAAEEMGSTNGHMFASLHPSIIEVTNYLLSYIYIYTLQYYYYY